MSLQQQYSLLQAANVTTQRTFKGTSKEARSKGTNATGLQSPNKPTLPCSPAVRNIQHDEMKYVNTNINTPATVQNV